MIRTLLAALSALIYGTVLLPLMTLPAAAQVSCYVEASAGAQITSTETSAGGTSIETGSDALLGSVGAGCDYRTGKLVLGPFIRYDLTHLDTKLALASIQQDGQLMIAARAGYMVNKSSMAYALGGITFSELSIPAIQTVDTDGYVVGLGYETEILGVPAFVEWNHLFSDDEQIQGVNLDPSSNVIRVGIRIPLHSLFAQ